MNKKEIQVEIERIKIEMNELRKITNLIISKL